MSDSPAGLRRLALRSSMPSHMPALLIMALVAVPSAFACGFHSPLVSYNNPYEFWQKAKDAVGFGSGEYSANDAEVVKRVQDLTTKIQALQAKLANSTEPGNWRGKAREELKKFQTEHDALLPSLPKQDSSGVPAGTRKERRRWFITELIKGVKYINTANVTPAEFPAFTRDQKGALTGIGRVFVEIGEPAVPYLWATLVQDIRYAGVNGAEERAGAQGRLAEIERRITQLQTRIQKDDREKEELQREIEKLAQEQEVLNAQLTSTEDESLQKNRDFIKVLQEIIVKIGEPASFHIAADLGHSNGGVARMAANLLKEIGLPAVPAIVNQLSIRGREANAASLLRRMSGESWGEDAETWRVYYRKQGVRFPGDPEPPEPISILRTLFDPPEPPEEPAAPQKPAPKHASLLEVFKPKEARKPGEEKEKTPARQEASTFEEDDLYIRPADE